MNDSFASEEPEAFRPDIYRSVFEEAPDPIGVLDPDGRFRDANHAMRALVAPSGADLAGRVLADLVEPQDAGLAERLVEACATTEAACRTTLRMAPVAGLRRWLTLSARRLRGGAGIALQAVEVTDTLRGASHLETIEEATGSGSWEVEPGTSLVHWSPGTFRIHDLLPGDDAVLPERAAFFYPPAARARINDTMRVLIETGRSFDLELPLVTATGREIWVRVIGAVSREAGGPARIHGTIQNITGERMRREHALRLGAVAETTTNGVMILGPEGRIEWVNAGFTQLTGHPPGEAIGANAAALLHSENSDPQIAARIGAVREAGRSIVAEKVIRGRDGRDRETLVDLQPLHDGAGELQGHVCMLTDIGAIKAYQRRLEAAEQSAQTAQARLVAAIEALDDAFVLHDAQDRLVLCNERYREIYGYSRDAIQPGATFEEILRAGLAKGQPPYATGREEDWLAERLEQHRRADRPTERFHSGRWLRVVERPTPDGGRVGLRIDISELRERQAELEATRADLVTHRELLATTLEHLGLGVHVVDDDMRLIYCNSALSELLGLPPESCRVGAHISELIALRHSLGHYGDRSLEAMLEERMAMFMSPQPHVFEAVQQDGRILEIRGNPLPSGGFVTTYHDVTEERRLRSALENSRREADEANAAKSRFLANMSHELRTPMNGVLGMAGALADTPLDPAQREMLELMRSSGGSLLSILNDILDLSRIEAGQIGFTVEPFDLGDLLDAVGRNYRMLAEAKGLGFGISLDPGLRIRVLGDPTRIRQILDNLLVNAVKFTETGEVELAALHLGTLADGRVAMRFSVRDTGPGIAAAHVGTLFVPFSQPDVAATRARGGTGLGLSIARELAELMGGRIDLETAEGAGSTFLVELALPVADVATALPPPQDPAEMLAGLGPRILVAEDNHTNRVVIKHMLAPLAPRLDFVGNGAEAVGSWAGGGHDLVLMDVRMPVLDGAEATREIRRREAREGRARIPIVALTANAMAEQVREYLDAGMDAHLAKPFRRDELFRLLARFLLPGGNRTPD